MGVAELVESHVTTTRRGGRLALATIPSQIALLLHMTQLDQIFDLFDTVDHAVECLARTDVESANTRTERTENGHG